MDERPSREEKPTENESKKVRLSESCTTWENERTNDVIDEREKQKTKRRRKGSITERYRKYTKSNQKANAGMLELRLEGPGKGRGVGV